MYVTKVNDQDFAIKPMNCPGSILIYKEKMHSYRGLPLRFAELGLVHRHDHIFCTKEHLEEEITSILKLAFKILSQFDFNDYVISISLRSKEKEQKYLGDEVLW